ncbi:hypothetical protein LVDJXP189_680010 [Flavobacterium psychrophilum]|nr:hypothetical protein FPSM_01089 [Flavobacterium psychrophilum]SNB43918.1 hypothetical protein LVDJXP189_680010 [Flavobacterium psychrophilum]
MGIVNILEANFVTKSREKNSTIFTVYNIILGICVCFVFFAFKIFHI